MFTPDRFRTGIGMSGNVGGQRERQAEVFTHRFEIGVHTHQNLMHSVEYLPFRFMHLIVEYRKDIIFIIPERTAIFVNYMLGVGEQRTGYEFLRHGVGNMLDH